MKAINIALDVFSYSNDIWSVSDYSGEQVYSKLALPLFRYEGEELLPLAAISFTQTPDNIVIHLRDDLLWSNGDAVIADDYVRAINYIIGSQNNRYQKLLLSVIRHPRGVEATSQYTLSISTAWYDPFIRHYFTLLNFSPMHANNRDLHAGPYEIVENTDSVCKLTANPFYPSDGNKNNIEEINYLLLPSDPDAQAFHLGQVHVSCDTSLDLRRYQRCLYERDFHQGNDTLVMLLSPGNKFNELPDNVLQIIGRTVNRLDISAYYGHVLKPLKSWLSLYQHNYDECDFTKASTLSLPVTIDLAFEDFYPNKQILQLLTSQFTSNEITINLHQEPYGNWNADCHFRFEIRKVPKSNPIKFFRSDISRMSEDAACFDEIKAIYSQLFDIKKSDKQLDIFKKIDLHLRRQLLYLPLFIFPTGYFCHSAIDCKTLMLPGSKVKLRGANESKT